MVFESVFSNLLNTYLNEFIDDLSANQLKVGAFSGNVELTNLAVKSNAFDSLNLPFKVVYGHIGSFRATVPWVSLYTSPVVFHIQKVYILCVPNADCKYDEETEKKQAEAEKKKQLQRIEEAMKLADLKDKGLDDNAGDDFVSKLVAQIVKNLEIKIEDIHICYEDKFTNPKCPFSIGLTLKRLNFVTLENQAPKYESAKQENCFEKDVTLKFLSIYWNCSSKLKFISDMSDSDKPLVFQKRIASEKNELSLTYILKPNYFTAKTWIDRKPKDDSFAFPMFDIDMALDHFALTINRGQMQSAILLLDSIDRMKLAAPYRKWRPCEPVKNNASLWWKFAITSLLETNIRQKNKVWSWTYIKSHRKLMKEYKEAYTNFLRSGKKSGQHVVDEIERRLDVFNIVLVRSGVKLELDKKAAEKTETQGWFSWFWSGSENKNGKGEAKPILEEFKKEMTSEEKVKLYQAIGYEESSPTEYPGSYEAYLAGITLSTINFVLFDEKSDTNLVSFVLDRVTTLAGYRPATNGLRLDLRVKDIDLQGSSGTKLIINQSPDQNLLELSAVTHPVDKSFDYSLTMKARGIDFVCHTPTLYSLMDMMTPQEDVSLQQIQALAQIKFDQFKMMSVTGLEYAIEKHSKLKIDIIIEPSYIIVPDRGCLSGCNNVLILSAGQVRISSLLSRTKAPHLRLQYQDSGEEALIKAMRENAYEHYKLAISKTQLILTNAADWGNDLLSSKMDEDNVSHCHLIKPFGAELCLMRSIIDDDPEMPRMRVEGEVDSILFKAQNSQLCRLFNLLLTLPTPSPEKLENLIIETPRLESMQVNEAKAATDALKIAQETAMAELRASSLQVTNLILNFTVDEFTCDLRTDEDKELLKFCIKRLGTEVCVKIYDTIADLYLGGILVQVRDLDAPEDRPPYKLVETTEATNLLNLKYRMISKNGPTFDGVAQSIELRVAAIQLSIDSPILDELLIYSQKIFDSMPAPSQPDRAVERRTSISSQLSANLLQSFKLKPKEKSSETKPTINLQTVISVNSVVLAIGGICSTTLEGLESDLSIFESGRVLVKAQWNDFKILNCIKDKLGDESKLERKLVHSKIIESQSKKVLEIEVIIFTPSEVKSRISDVDIKCNVHFGRLKIVFLNEFVARLVNFLTVFENAKKRALAASSKAAGFAKQTAISAYESATKIGLDIILEAPLLIVPRNWESSKCLAIDLGKIVISNEIRKVNSALIDFIKCQLSNFRVSATEVEQCQHEEHHDNLIDPISFDLQTNRNLTFENNKSLPEMDVSATLNEITLSISQFNLMLMMSILNENISDIHTAQNNFSQETLITTSVAKETKAKKKDKTRKKNFATSLELPPAVTHSRIVEEAEVHVDATGKEELDSSKPTCSFMQYQMSFSMPKVNLVLYQNDKKEDPNRLTRAYLAGFDIFCKMLTNGSMTALISMSDIVLEDERPSKKRKRLRKLMYCNEYIKSDGDEFKTFRVNYVKGTDTKVDIDMSGFTLIFALDFLMQLSNVVTTGMQGLPQTPKMDQTNLPSIKGIAKSSKNLVTDRSIAMPVDTPLMTLCFRMSQGDILMIESVEIDNPPAIVFNSLVDIDVKMKDDVMSLKAAVGQIQLGLTNLETYRQKKKVENYIVTPFEINLFGEITGSVSQHIDIEISEIGLIISPNTLQMVLSILGTVASSREEEIVASDEDKMTEEKALFIPSLIGDWKNYNFLMNGVSQAIEATEDLVFEEVAEIRGEKPFILQQLIVKFKSVSVTIESGGMDSQPLVKLNSSHTIILDNWKRLHLNCFCYMDYYNEKTFAWEPIIEKIDNEPWHFELQANVINEDDSGSRISAFLDSKTQLELSLSKTAINVITDLGLSFKSAVKKLDTPLLGQNVFEFSNFTGMDLKIEVDARKFSNKSFAVSSDDENRLVVDLKGGEVVVLNNIHETSSELENKILCRISHHGQSIARTLSLRGQERKCFKFPQLSYHGDEYKWVFDLSQRDPRSKRIVFGSTVEITNHVHVPVRLYFIDISGNLEENTFLHEIQPRDSYFLPVDIVYAKYQCVFVKPSDEYCTPKEAITWNSKDRLYSQFFSTIACEHKKQEPDFFIRIKCETEEMRFEDSYRKSPECMCFKFNLYPVLQLRNFLPLSVEYTLACFDQNKSQIQGVIKPGDTSNLVHLNLKSHKMEIQVVDYLDQRWKCENKFPIRWTKEDQIEIWSFVSLDGETLDLTMNFSSNEGGCRVASLFAPFWMINKTGKKLTYKIGEQLTSHFPDRQMPILLSFKPKTLFSKKKLSLAFEDSKFSDAFSIDAVGNRGNIITKGNDRMSYCASIEIELSDFGFTKVVTVSPFYSIVNKSNIDLEVSEDNDVWFPVASKSSRSLWPDTTHDPEVYFRLSPETVSSKPISLKEHSSILHRVGDRLVVVNVDITENSVVVQLTNYYPGSAPVHIFNTLEDVHVDYGQNLVQFRKRLPPMHNAYFTWHDPSKSPLNLIWSTSLSEEVVVDLSHDNVGSTSQGNLYYACFLYGQQRILLITRDQVLAQSTLQQTEFNKPYFDLELILKGIGISLVNNDQLKEVAYIGITSSEILWEVRKQRSKRYKPLSVKQIEALENAFQKALQRGQISGVLKIPKSESKATIVTVENMKVDFSDPDNMRMLEPYTGVLRRNAASGVWLAVSLSEHVIQFHMKVNRIQIDNQMDQYIFGIVMCPILPPRSLTMDRAPKAFFEISTVIQRQLNMMRFNFIAILIQEFLIQIDGDFLMALLEFVSVEKQRSNNYEKMLQKSLKRAFEDTNDYTEIPVSSKNFYDSIHFSPIKVHVSFSLGETDSFQLFGAFDFLIKSAGVTLTEFKDVLFKIDYFERKNVLLSNGELMTLAIGHYVRQVLKQFYVVVLGLDVIGNPVGLFLGLKQGVGDFFYEPFIGIIEGPEEFAEGLALGVRSLFSHTVGGAAGALGKITGTLGDGISTLTMDQEARRKRRERINKRQTFVQSGANLFRGFASGITGVVTKPVKGAQKEGFEGLVKGLGRGVVGIVADPVTGAMDFASGSFNALQRAVDINAIAKRQRPSRHFHADGILRSYNNHEAVGKSILRDVEKGRFSSDSYFAHNNFTPETVVLITDNRILHLRRSCISKVLDLEWHETLDNIEHMEIIDHTQVLITLKENRKKLGGLIAGEKCRVLNCPKPEVAKWLVEKVFQVKQSGPLPPTNPT